jgi:hypothetical protein
MRFFGILELPRNAYDNVTHNMRNCWDSKILSEERRQAVNNTDCTSPASTKGYTSEHVFVCRLLPLTACNDPGTLEESVHPTWFRGG